MGMLIDEPTAWSILQQYVQDLGNIDTDSIIAVYATGSLGGGYFRPGQSDIDAALIVRDGSETVWGDSMNPSARLQDINQRYLHTYNIPKDFGPFPLQVHELFPPYDPAKELVHEIARLKVQGKLVFGQFDLSRVPMPTPADHLADIQHFEKWWQDEFEPANPVDGMTAGACVNTILIHLSRFLWVKRNRIEFNKRRIVAAYVASAPPFVDTEALRLVEMSLNQQPLTEQDVDRLRQTVKPLRQAMDRYLGVSGS